MLDRGTTAVELLRWAEKVTKPFSVAVISEDALAKENKGLIQQIKQYSDSTDIQILLLGDDQLKDEDRRMGVADYLTRPVSQSQLFEALMGLLDSKVSLADSVLESTAQTDNAHRNRRVLLAEDNLGNQLVAKLQLERRGYSRCRSMQRSCGRRHVQKGTI